VVAQDVRTVTWEVAIFWVAVLSLVVTLVYGERQRPNHAIQQKSDGERLRRAWEEVALRPDLVVSFELAVMEYPPPNRGSQYVKAAIVFRITNNGKSAAHNVHCEIRLDEERSEPDDMHRKNRDFYAPDMEPKATKSFSKRVSIRLYGPTKAHYRCVCDEVRETKGVVEFEVPEKSS
jgi:hypothetical protein